MINGAFEMTIDYQIQCDAFNSFPTHELTFVRVSQSPVFVGIQILYQNNGFISPVDGVEEKIVDIIKHYGHGENDQILHKNCVFGEFVYIYILYENIRNWCCVFEICSQINVHCHCTVPILFLFIPSVHKIVFKNLMDLRSPKSST